MPFKGDVYSRFHLNVGESRRHAHNSLSRVRELFIVIMTMIRAYAHISIIVISLRPVLVFVSFRRALGRAAGAQGLIELPGLS